MANKNNNEGGPKHGKAGAARREEKEPRPIRRLTDRRLDFAESVPLRQAYIVGSTERSGSTFLCSELWKTGVLGAPAEYWNYRDRRKSKAIGTQMMVRLDASTPAEYITKLLACRTTKNGVFGMNVHHVDFDHALAKYPDIFKLLFPVRYIYIQREDKVAQAVSMVKAAQTGAWVSSAKPRTGKLQYNAELISDCLRSIAQQERDWTRWFEANDVTPFRVVYEELVKDPERIVSNIVEFLGASGDAPQDVSLPKIEKQSDDTSREWIARYRRETEGQTEGVPFSEAQDLSEGSAMSEMNRNGSAEQSQDGSFLDRFNALTGAARPIRAKRLRHRYEAIIAANRALFDKAKVLDIHCGDGFWSLAALDAGASSAVGVDSQREEIKAARRASADLGMKPDACEFVSVNVQIFSKLRTYRPESFDAVICQDLTGMPDLHFLFKNLHRLKPKHVILDTAVIGGKLPFALFKFKEPGEEEIARRPVAVTAIPNHELIRILCNYFGFKWRLFEWRKAGISDWTGIQDYERDWRRTYVLDRDG